MQHTVSNDGTKRKTLFRGTVDSVGGGPRAHDVEPVKDDEWCQNCSVADIYHAKQELSQCFNNLTNGNSVSSGPAGDQDAAALYSAYFTRGAGTEERAQSVLDSLLVSMAQMHEEDSRETCKYIIVA